MQKLQIIKNEQIRVAFKDEIAKITHHLYFLKYFSKR